MGILDYRYLYKNCFTKICLLILLVFLPIDIFYWLAILGSKGREVSPRTCDLSWSLEKAAIVSSGE